MSPSSISSWAGVCLCVTLEPSKWKRTFLLSMPDMLDKYWEKTEPSGESWDKDKQVITSLFVLLLTQTWAIREEILTLCRENSWEEALSLLCSLTVMLSLLLLRVSPSSSAAITSHSATTNKKLLQQYLMCNVGVTNMISGLLYCVMLTFFSEQ